MKSDNCFYCKNKIEGKRRLFCSVVCLTKYWKGVYRGEWKEGDMYVGKDKPTKLEIRKAEETYQVRKISYLQIKSGKHKCDLCGKEAKINRHSNGKAIMVLCSKCLGWAKKYNNLKTRLHNYNTERRFK